MTDLLTDSTKIAKTTIACRKSKIDKEEKNCEFQIGP